MTFAHPWVLILLVLPVLLGAWEWQRRGHALVLPVDHTGYRPRRWLERAVKTANLLVPRLLAVPIVLLKGTAYVMADLPPARGRMLGDLDLMVPRDRIDEVERTLIAAGWLSAELNDYDQRYYREWTHEIPPLRHPDRDTEVDIHHTIVASTSRALVDAAALLAAHRLWIEWLDEGRVRKLALVAERNKT